MAKQQSSRGYVLLDSCIYCADLHGAGTNTTVLVEGIERLKYSLLLPEVIRDEVIAKHSHNLSDVTTAYEKSQREVRRFLHPWEKIDFPKVDSGKLVQDYAKRFPYGIHKTRIVVLPYPATPHREIAQRAILRRKPFKEGGAGYRDALIFETLKEYLLQHPDHAVSFVSLNHRDFFEDNELHPCLVDDLKRAGIDPARVMPFMDLGSLNQSQVFPHLQSLDKLREALQVEMHPMFKVRDWINSDLLELLRDEDWGAAIIGVDCVYSYPSKCGEPEKVKVDDVKLLPSGDLLVQFSMRIEIEVSVSYDGEAYDKAYNAMCELFGEPDGPVGYTSTSVPVSTHVGVSLVLDKDCSQVKSSQVDSLEGHGGYYTVEPDEGR